MSKESIKSASDEIKNVALAAAQVIKTASEEAAKVLAAASVANNNNLAVMSADIIRIKEDIKEIKESQRDSAKNSVSTTDWQEHLKKDADHEARLRVLEGQTEEYALVKKLVFGCVTIILVAVVTAVIYLVIKQ